MNKLIAAIKVKNLSLYYNTQKILEGISMDIYQDKVTAIIGPSGCGKSTFIKCLNRMNELEAEVHVEGKVEFYNQNIYERRVNLNRLRRQVSMVLPKPNLFPMSVYDNVAYGVKILGWRPKVELDQIVESAIKDADLWDEVKNKLHKSALELSGGQQQRLCIARALAVKPKVILMDEPCFGLDPVATTKVEGLIQSLRLRSELTMVIISHNLQQVTRISDFTAFFSTNEHRIGQMVEFGLTKKIFSNALDVRTREYVLTRLGGKYENRG
ncbi:phosphate ABC transporter ATP-binding protein [Nostoc sp. FACHB-87]|uniref:phosphate ABC transporter ATP-binding protein n=1 Tax=Nostocales TaxID=1161 RepID=UPI001689FE1D|nr:MULTISPECIES: phosphate ABC transporter ATP-binding protein [Nostocales]MBD2302051.1 phosphate ABC transporter ATP-binding protein [Nostoc sp. FACHB-190]MBD2455474.1 phosphate ABC transporter ATP-binding protein [Nostoc sp. FACHB-87]MBD2475874.1 phosphate ABC transporter ATP-binding protein [Anabaena sp. FACHB-83]MBD2490800.1 phosphate ABC transporter ATP-binding protein [Aulosira sp. FACHB-615]